MANTLPHLTQTYGERIIKKQTKVQLISQISQKLKIVKIKQKCILIELSNLYSNIYLFAIFNHNVRLTNSSQVDISFYLKCIFNLN